MAFVDVAAFFFAFAAVPICLFVVLIGGIVICRNFCLNIS